MKEYRCAADHEFAAPSDYTPKQCPAMPGGKPCTAPFSSGYYTEKTGQWRARG